MTRLIFVWPFMISALFVAGLAGVLWFEASEFVDDAQPLVGSIESRQGSHVGGTSSNSIVVSFTTPDGKREAENIELPWPLSGGDVGDAVKVLWNPKKSDSLWLDSLWGLWGKPVFVGALSLLLSALALMCEAASGRWKGGGQAEQRDD